MVSFHGSFDGDAWSKIFIFSVCCSCLLLFALLITVYQFCCNSSALKQIKFDVKLYSVSSLLCFLLANIFNLLYTYYVKLPTGTINTYTESFWGLYNTFWSFGYTFTYLLWYHRIKHTFKDSVHELGKTTSIKFLSYYLVM